MSGELAALCAGALVAIGLYGLLVQPALLRRILCFNLAGSGIFLLLGSIAVRDPGPGSDPVPQALAITGIVVALSVTAFALGLLRRYRALSGRDTLPDPPSGGRRPPDERGE